MANDIKILDHLNIDLDGDGIAERYEIGGMSELPIASTEVLGGVKIGENLSITEDGTLNAETSGTSVLSPGAILYDTKEKIIGKWIDGKPIYQKTVTTTEKVICNYIDYINVPCSNLPVNIDNLLCCKISEDFHSLYMTVAKIDSDNVLKIWSSAPQGSLGLNAGTYITLQYTKTTDEPNSFRPDMIENISIMRNLDFSNIYTEEERIIGCWVDGRPIYQKMLYFTIPNTTGNINYDTGIKNISTCINMNLSIQKSNGDYTKFCHAIWADQATIIEDSFLTTGIIQYYIRGTYWANGTARAILQYTKTTDAENSFTVDMLTDYENITDAEIADAAAADKI